MDEEEVAGGGQDNAEESSGGKNKSGGRQPLQGAQNVAKNIQNGTGQASKVLSNGANKLASNGRQKCS